MNKNKRTYYTNGVNEVRLYDWEEIPDGWVKGRVKSTLFFFVEKCNNLAYDFS